MNLFCYELGGFTGGDLSAPAAVAPGVDMFDWTNVPMLRSNCHEPERDEPE
jgi:hypothetical protein